MELEPNSLDWNGNELENELELEDMKRTNVFQIAQQQLAADIVKISKII